LAAAIAGVPLMAGAAVVAATGEAVPGGGVAFAEASGGEGGIFAADGIITAIFVGMTLPGAGWVAKDRSSASNSCAVWSIWVGSALRSNCSISWDISSFSRSMLGT
jgi:hypothetical protein